MEQSALMQWVGSALLFSMMLGMGMSMVWADIRRVVVYPRAVTVGTVNQMLLLPLLGWVLVSLFQPEPAIALGLILLTLCPGGVGSNVFSLLARGDAALSVTLTFISSCLIVLSLPLIFHWALLHFTGHALSLDLPVTDTMQRVFTLTLVPLAIGMLIRHYRPEWAQRCEPWVKVGGFVLLGLLIAGIVAKEFARIVDYAQRAGGIALGLCVGSMLLGFASARLLRLNRPQSIAIAIETGMQNSALAIVIAGMLNNPEIAIPAVIYTVFVSLICLGLVLHAQWPWRSAPVALESRS
ncbi:MAG: bile acid:sodium symporter family protein [Gammaproteobacteria bacterium]|nr:bile acid:sodium symporter family protein [Gammaproteobacteria bacterium]